MAVVRPKTGRDAKIVIAFMRGYTLKQLTNVFYISVERIRQAIKKMLREYLPISYLNLGLRDIRNKYRYRVITKMQEVLDECCA